MRCQERDIVVIYIPRNGHVYKNDIVYFETKDKRIENKYLFHNCSISFQTCDKTLMKILLQLSFACYCHHRQGEMHQFSLSEINEEDPVADLTEFRSGIISYVRTDYESAFV